MKKYCWWSSRKQTNNFVEKSINSCRWGKVEKIQTLENKILIFIEDYILFFRNSSIFMMAESHKKKNFSHYNFQYLPNLQTFYVSQIIKYLYLTRIFNHEKMSNSTNFPSRISQWYRPQTLRNTVSVQIIRAQKKKQILRQ